MLYAERDVTGQICDLHPAPIAGATEELAADDPEVLQYIQDHWRQNEFSELDRDFIRVIEDMIELLVAKELILFTDLPAKVQEKLIRRKEVRQLNGFNEKFGSGGDDIIPL